MKVSDVAHEYQDVVPTKDLLLVFWTSGDVRTMRSAQDFVASMQQRCVASMEWPSHDRHEHLYMAAVVPMPSDEEAFKRAKEIK